MRQRILLLLLFSTLSCKQACGLAAIEDGVGGSGAASGACSLGGAGTCLCEDSFNGAAVAACWKFEPNSETAPTPEGGSWFLPALGNSGYWEDPNTLDPPRFLFTDVPAGPFLAATCVRPYQGPTSNAWPVADYSLAGFIVRAKNGGPPLDQNWLKLEAGTIDGAESQQDEPTHGVRVARRKGDGDGGTPDVFGTGDSQIDQDNASLVLVMCRLDDERVLPFYGVIASGGALGNWVTTFDQGDANFMPTPLIGPAEIGLVAASLFPGIIAEFRWAFVARYAPGTLDSMAACQAELSNIDKPDCAP